MFNERIQQFILNTHRRVFPFPKGWMDATGPESGSRIVTLLQSGKPCLAARFGSIEMESIMAYLHQDVGMMPWTRFYRFASWDVRYTGWAEPLKQKLTNNAGFFPAEHEQLDRFAELYLHLAPHIDLIGSWIHAETLLQDRMPSVQRIPLPYLEPYLSPAPWSQALEHKRVLVIHPFTESISTQYAQREKLFENPAVLPQFELSTLKAVQSAGGSKVDFASWFDALEAMKTEINRRAFDVAIIGAGAYGLPLAAHVKSLGKQAVQMGGATQMLFGIYGQRWLNDPLRKKFINEHWVRPMPSEKITNASSIENSCYW
jgi:hypothetical protein